MTHPKLSIIVPCFNSSQVITRCLDSIFANKTSFLFEVIAVDDGSSDNTVELLASYKKKRRSLRVIKLHKNSGGGAARNKAISNSQGELIFSVDSDDLISPILLQQLVDYHNQTHADGVCASTIVNFRHGDITNVAYTNEIPVDVTPVTPKSLFGNCPLFRNFLITKSCLKEIRGYPEQHGFDTQGLAFRFLLNGKKAFVCPNSQYFQEVQTGKTYYVREYEKGNLSLNLITIIEEFLPYFPTQLQYKILSFPFAIKNTHEDNIISALKKSSELEVFFSKIKNNKNDYFQEKKQISKRMSQEKATIPEQYWLAVTLKNEGKLEESLKIFCKLFINGSNESLVLLRLMELLALVNNQSTSDFLKYVQTHITPRPLAFASRFHQIAVQLKNIQHKIKPYC